MTSKQTSTPETQTTDGNGVGIEPRLHVITGSNDGRPCVAALAAFMGLALFGGLVLVNHVALANLSPSRHMLSEYSHAPLGQILNLVAFLALGAASLLMTVEVRRALAPGPGRRIGTMLMAVWSASWLPTAIFVTDVGLPEPTVQGALHTASVVIGTLCFSAGALVLATAFGIDARFRHLQAPSRALGIAVTMLLVSVVCAPAIPIVGYVQRAAFSLVLLWFGLLASTLWRPTERSTSRSTGALGPVPTPGLARSLGLAQPPSLVPSGKPSAHQIGKGGSTTCRQTT